MKTLKKYKIIQLLAGALLSCLILSAGFLVTSIVTSEILSSGSVLPKIVSVVYPMIFTAIITFIAIVAKFNDLKHLYYPVFFINIISLISAFLYEIFYQSFFIFVIPFSKIMGLPFNNFATAADEYGFSNAMTVLVMFLVGLLISVAAFQLFAVCDKHREVLSRWRLGKPARVISIVTICYYGTFIAISILLQLLPYGNNATLIGEFVTFTTNCLASWSVAMTVSFQLYILPVLIALSLYIICLVRTIKTSNPRQMLNPLVLLAIILSLLGSYMMYSFVLSGF